MSAQGNDLEALLGRALTLHQAGEVAAADAIYARLLAHLPNLGQLHFLRGAAAFAQGRPEDAARFYARAVELSPEMVEIRNEYGLTLRGLGRAEEAEAQLRAALALEPNLAGARFNLGNALLDQGRHEEALEAFLAAQAQAPDMVVAKTHAGIALERLGRLDEAEAALTQALARDSGQHEGWFALGNVAGEKGDPARAEAAYARALVLNPEWEEAHLNLAQLLLGQGRLDEGWAHYEWRRPARLAARGERVSAPVWDGGALRGETLLLWREQGLGDQILFASMIEEAAARAKKVIVAVEPRLVALFARSFPQVQVTGWDEPPNPAQIPPGIDRQLPLGGLPRLFRPHLDDFPARASWLLADPARTAPWRGWLDGLGPGPKVGLCWRSRLREGNRARKFADLDQWAPLLRVPGVQWVNLQYDDCEAELAQVERALGITIHRPPRLDLTDDLDGVAALMAALDRVISAPTVVCEMAGALGRPTWRMCLRPHWSTLGTGQSPWMPSLRCYTASLMGGWPAIFEAAAADLAARP